MHYNITLGKTFSTSLKWKKTKDYLVFQCIIHALSYY